MDLKRDFEITMQQPLYGISNTHIGDFFKLIIDDCEKHVGGVAESPRTMMSHSFNYGLIQGKRSERARRRGEAFDIDGPHQRTDDELLYELVDALESMTVGEITELHALAMEKIQPDEKVKAFISYILNSIIEDKGKAPNHPDN